MEKRDLRIVFMGTPEFAVETLRALVEGGYNVVAVVTQPDKPVGRHGSVLRAPAVKEYALSVGLPVLQPEKMKDAAFVEQLRSYEPDLQIVVAFRVLPEVVWAMPRFGTFNVHAALLPQYRGAAPINWAIINGETTTGVTTFFLDHDIDTGRIILQKKFNILDNADVEYVYNGLMHLGAEIAIETIDLVISCNGLVSSVSQDDVLANEFQVSSSKFQLKLAPKLFKENCRIEWNQHAKNIYDFIRGLSPVPTAWTTLVSHADNEDGKSVSPIDIKIFKTQKTSEECHETPGTIRATKTQLFVATSDHWLEIFDLQLAGKKRMPARDFLNGFKSIADYHME